MKQSAKTGNSPTPSAEELMFSLLHAAHALEERWERALAEVGLSGPKFGVLTHIVEAGEPLSLSECAAKMTCVRSNMTQLVDRLEADGLVTRAEDPADRRAVRAAITALGRQRQAAGAQQVAKVREAFSKSLSGIDQAALKRVLSAIE